MYFIYTKMYSLLLVILLENMVQYKASRLGVDLFFLGSAVQSGGRPSRIDRGEIRRQLEMPAAQPGPWGKPGKEP